MFMKVHNFLGTKMSTFRVNPQNCEILAPRKYGRTCSEPVFTHTHTHTHTHAQFTVLCSGDSGPVVGDVYQHPTYRGGHKVPRWSVGRIRFPNCHGVSLTIIVHISLCTSQLHCIIIMFNCPIEHAVVNTLHCILRTFYILNLLCFAVLSHVGRTYPLATPPRPTLWVLWHRWPQ